MSLIGPIPVVKAPQAPTPWRADSDGEVFDAKDNLLFVVSAGALSCREDIELAKEIVRLVNEAHEPRVVPGVLAPRRIARDTTRSDNLLAFEAKVRGTWWWARNQVEADEFGDKGWSTQRGLIDLMTGTEVPR